MPKQHLDIGGHKYWLDGYLYQNLKKIKDVAIPNEWDAVFIVFGPEGSGKSTLASQVVRYLDNDIPLDRCVFRAPEFKQAVDDAEDEDGIWWDEPIYGAKASQHASEISQTIINKLTIIRDKKLKIVLCFPYLFMLNKYFVTRALGTFYVYAKAYDKRGYFRFYSRRKTHYIFNLMKSKYRYDWLKAIDTVKSNFYGDFSKQFCMPYNEYRKKKRLASKDIDGLGKREATWRERAVITVRVAKEAGVSQRDIARAWGVSDSAISQVVSKFK